ncbi:MAG TPA: hypothetical protein DCL21_01885, partial [Alphaproteobacteria bacterium]|nr:hypothetical protein [Alphaproteobacteria bacterium]
MIKLLLFRHGETNWNVKQRFQGHTNIPLNLTGLAQAFELSQKIESEKIDLMVSSDLSRALQTARVVMKKRPDEIPMVLSKKLRESNFGVIEGSKFSDSQAKYDNIFKIWDDPSHEKTFDVSIPDGETPRQVINRFLECLDESINSYPNVKTIAISTHGGVMRQVYKYLTLSLCDFRNCEVLEL